MSACEIDTFREEAFKQDKTKVVKQSCSPAQCTHIVCVFTKKNKNNTVSHMFWNLTIISLSSNDDDYNQYIFIYDDEDDDDVDDDKTLWWLNIILFFLFFMNIMMRKI